jgi:hypothetical protein
VRFWEAQCPVRQPGLPHKHDRDCDDGCLGDQCCECGQRASHWTEPVVARVTRVTTSALDDFTVDELVRLGFVAYLQLKGILKP